MDIGTETTSMNQILNGILQSLRTLPGFQIFINPDHRISRSYQPVPLYINRPLNHPIFPNDFQ